MENLLLEIPHVNLYRLVGNIRQELCLDKTMKIYKNPKENIFYIEVDIFKYTIYQQIAFLRHGSQFFYTFPDVDSYYGLEIPKDTALDTIEKFQQILSQNAFFTITPYEMEAPKKQGEKTPEKSTAESIASFITATANFIKSAFIKTAEVTTKGVKKGGEYIESKVAPNQEPMKVGDKTKSIVSGTKNVTTKIHTLADTSVFYISLLLIF